MESKEVSNPRNVKCYIYFNKKTQKVSDLSLSNKSSLNLPVTLELVGETVAMFAVRAAS